MKKLNTVQGRMIALVLALVMMLATVMPANVMAQAAEEVTADVAADATPGDADGIYTAEDGYIYYYVGGQISKKTGWVKVDDTFKVRLDSKYRVQFAATVKNKINYISKFDDKQKALVTYTKNVVVLDDKNLYYAGADGAVVTTAGKVSDGKGTTYYLGKNGVVTSKLVKSGEARRYYTYSSGKWNALKGAYKTIDGVLYYFNSASGIAAKMYKNSTNQLYRYSSSKMKLVKSDIATVRGNRIYFFNSKGQKITKAGWYTIASGARVYVNKNGYVAAKMPASGKSRKYYSYDYKSLKWVAKKSTWINVNGVEYYFAKNGVAVYMYNTKSGKFTDYKNGKWNSAKNTIHSLKNGKIYLFNSKSIVVKKAGWYSINSTDKVYVSSKGYVTMKFSTKSGKLNKYNYSKKKWELVKVTSYKIGSNTYYFNSKGILAKGEIVGDSKTGYFYVDETGCKVTSTEIQLVVNFIRQHTDDSMTREQKLYACFAYLSRNYPYLRDYVVPTDASRFTYYCIDMLTNNHGNCYRCAATFATVATVLGYKARVTCGQVTNLQGDGFTIHGWTELWRPEDNEWVVYDVSMQRNWPARDYYHVLMRNYYPTHRIIGPRARLTVTNGKVNWRWLANSELGDH